jgi:hypothetical protein
VDTVTIPSAADHGVDFSSNQKVKGEKRVYVLSYCEALEQWTFTTKENYLRMIKNARETHRFSKVEGFRCTTDVIHYILEHFDVTLDQITCCVDC